MKKTATILASILSLAALFVSAGCGSNAEYVEAGGSRSLISTDKINIADWNKAADALVNSMLASSAFEKLKKPAILQVSRIINRTSESIDTDMLTRKITMVLGNSGKVRVVSQDAATSELAEYEAEMTGKKVAQPKITMTGKILEDRESNSDLREVTYTFFLEVNYRGTPIWSGEKQITKQSEKSSFGF